MDGNLDSSKIPKSLSTIFLVTEKKSVPQIKKIVDRL